MTRIQQVSLIFLLRAVFIVSASSARAYQSGEPSSPFDANNKDISRVTIESTQNAPPVGPYSSGVLMDGMLYIAGVSGSEQNGSLAVGGIGAQTTQALRRIGFILEAAGTNFTNVIKVNVYLTDIRNFDAMNTAYAPFWPDRSYPARTVVEITSLVRVGALVQMEAVAVLGKITQRMQYIA